MKRLTCLSLSAVGCAAVIAPVAAQTFRPLPAEGISRRLDIGGPVLVSTWPAGFPATTTWQADHIIAVPEGVVLNISGAAEGAERPFVGAEFQTQRYSPVWGRVEWQARLPDAPSGSAAAMFLFKSPYDLPADRELDFEYLPGDPNTDHAYGTMQMSLHMSSHEGGSKESTDYRIDVPKECIEEICGWAIEFQPERVVFQLQVTPEESWETIASYRHAAGWELTAGARWNGGPAGQKRRVLSPETWSELPMNAFASYWITDDRVSWLGRIDAAALEAGAPPFVLQSMTPIAFDTLPALGDDDWSVEPNGSIAIHAMPESALDATEIQFRIDGGAWQTLGPAVPGSYKIDSLVPAGSLMDVRTVARGPAFAESEHEVVSTPSGPKSAE